MTEWDNKWYEAWMILLAKLDLAEILTIAKIFDIERVELYGSETEDELKRRWIGAIGDRLREMRQAEEYRKKAAPALRALKELMGLWS